MTPDVETLDTQLRYVHDWDHSLELNICRDGGLEVVVSEEKAMDSYNETFDCSYRLSVAQAIELRDWLLAHYPQADA